MSAEMFAPELYANTRRSLPSASTLPHWCYTSREWYEREIESMFRSKWLCVGRVDQVPNVGDYYAISLLGQPLIVVRESTQSVRVHSAVCRHRGAVLVGNDSHGHCRSLVCPYHSWTYSLDGRLVATPGVPPPMTGVQGFTTAEFGLAAIRSQTWGGFLFVTFNASAPDLQEQLGDLPVLLHNYRVGDMQFTHRDIYEVECNWKVWLENAFESYHAMTVHRKHMNLSARQNWSHGSGLGYEFMFSERSAVAYAGLPELEGLAAKERSGLYHVWVPPNLQLIVTSSYLKYRQYLPEGPEKLRLIENWSFPLDTINRADFESIAGPGYYAKYAQIIEEDRKIVPVVQQGLRSGAYRPGRYSLDEYIVHRIANYVLDHVVGPPRAFKGTADPRMSGEAIGAA